MIGKRQLGPKMFLFKAGKLSLKYKRKSQCSYLEEYGQEWAWNGLGLLTPYRIFFTSYRSTYLSCGIGWVGSFSGLAGVGLWRSFSEESYRAPDVANRALALASLSARALLYGEILRRLRKRGLCELSEVSSMAYRKEGV